MSELSRKVFLAETAAVREHLAEQEQQPPADRAALHDRIAAVIRKFPFDDFGLDDVSYLLEDQPDTQEWVPKLAAAVLAVLPEPVDRAVVYAEVADRLAADAEQGDKEGFTRIYRRAAAKQVREWGEELRRMAAEQPASRGRPAFLTSPCSAGDWCCKGPGTGERPATEVPRCACAHARPMHTGTNLFCAVPGCECTQYAAVGARQDGACETGDMRTCTGSCPAHGELPEQQRPRKARQDGARP